MVRGSGSDDGNNLPKIIKMGNKEKKTSSSVPRSSIGETIPKVDSPANPTEISVKKTADIHTAFDSDALRQQMPGVNSSEKRIGKLKESELPNASTQKSDDKISHVSNFLILETCNVYLITLLLSY